ncbi:MAG: sel1 repeat family protein [Bacteroidales bacterium]|nr:sel1 repeat family protein [Bacteroidales bacterium]
MNYIFINTDIYTDVDIDFSNMQFISTIIVVPKFVVNDLSNQTTLVAKKALNRLNDYRKLSFFQFDTDDTDDDCKDIIDYISLKYAKQPDKFLVTFIPKLLDKANSLFPHIRFFGKNREFDNKTSEILYPQFVKKLKYLTETNDTSACFYMGYCFRYGYGVSINYDCASDWFKKTMDNCDVHTLIDIGDFFNGLNKRQEAISCFTKAAKLGDIDSELKLANIYFGQSDFDLAQQWAETAAKNNNANAQLLLGMFYYNGIGGNKPNYNEAVNYFTMAANNGNGYAQAYLGLCHYLGNGVEQNFDKAFIWFQKTEQFNVSWVQYYLGECYLNGYGVKKDDNKAFDLFETAANYGDSLAQKRLGDLWFYGHYNNNIYYMPDYKNAAGWYEKSANQGNADAQAALGTCYFEGKGVEKNVGIATSWYLKSANQDNVFGLFYFGKCLYDGNGIAKDIKQASVFLEKAAHKNNASAKYYLALCYLEGYEITIDEKKCAFEILNKLVLDDKYTQALYKLAYCYEYGIGVNPDAKKAFQYYSAAVKNDEKTAYYDYARCCEKGIGTKVLLDKAIEYYKRAAQDNNPDALYALGILYDKQRINGKANIEEAIGFIKKAADAGSKDAALYLEAKNKNTYIEDAFKNLNISNIENEHKRAQGWYLASWISCATFIAGLVAYMWWNICSPLEWSPEAIIRIFATVTLISFIFISINQAARMRKTLILLSKEMQEYKYIEGLLKAKVILSVDSLETNQEISKTISDMIQIHLDMQKDRIGKEDYTEVKDITPELLNFVKDNYSSAIANSNDMTKALLTALKEQQCKK